MPKLWIDNVEVDAPEGSTLLQAAGLAGKPIPHLCYLEGIEPQTSCLVCIVRVNGGKRLLPSCGTRVEEGMVVESDSPAVRQARKTALELLLSEHAGECFAPCSQVCPAHLDIPGMVRQVREGDLAGAIQAARSALILPATLGYICPELCEKGCRRGSADAAVSICQLHRYVGEKDLASGEPWLPEKAPATGKRVAIVGSGPAGLAAAWELLLAGHACDLIDAKPLAGGTLRYGLPEGQLPSAVLDAEIALIARLGAGFRMGLQVGTDVTLRQLRGEYNAVAVTQGPAGDEPGVFASASSASARPHAVQAVADGRELGRGVAAWLSGDVREARRRFAVRLGAMSEAEMARLMAGGDGRARTQAQGTLSDAQAEGEAQRCLLCGCGSIGVCDLRRYAMEYGAEVGWFRGARREARRIESHPELVFEAGKCISCGLCVAIARKAGEPVGLSFVGRGFEVQVAAPLGKDWAEALTKAADAAARACPTGAIHRR